MAAALTYCSTYMSPAWAKPMLWIWVKPLAKTCGTPLGRVPLKPVVASGLAMRMTSAEPSGYGSPGSRPT